MLEANIELCKYKVPVVAMPMPATATTGPASLYSNVAMSNAEALSALVIFELTEPGVPFIYASRSRRRKSKERSVYVRHAGNHRPAGGYR